MGHDQRVPPPGALNFRGKPYFRGKPSTLGKLLKCGRSGEGKGNQQKEPPVTQGSCPPRMPGEHPAEREHQHCSVIISVVVWKQTEESQHAESQVRRYSSIAPET